MAFFFQKEPMGLELVLRRKAHICEDGPCATWTVHYTPYPRAILFPASDDQTAKATQPASASQHVYAFFFFVNQDADYINSENTQYSMCMLTRLQRNMCCPSSQKGKKGNASITSGLHASKLE